MKNSYIEPIALEKGKLYTVSAAALVGDNGRNHDLARLVTAMQGLINRHFATHGVAVGLLVDGTDRFWQDYITGEGRTYAGMEEVAVEDTQTLLSTFAPFMQHCGIVAWDPEVPATANVAATLCGLEGYLPVQYNCPLYIKLTQELGVPVKMSLCGMFQGAKIGGKIAHTQMDSSGSAKCDAYLWAMDQYMDRCNTEFLAYTVDGGPAVPDNDLYTWKDCASAQMVGIFNHDYFIAKKMFFFDLTSYGKEVPQDDPTQPMGTDQQTMHKILQKRYDLAGGKWGMVMGFPPWHVKYTTHCNTDTIHNDLIPPRLEWHFVETTTSYNCSIEADAAHPCWLTNGSLYTNYQMVNKIEANQPAQEMDFDPEVLYYTLPYAGDYDCSPWLKERAAKVFSDENLGKEIFHFSYNLNLVDRIPMAIDFIYEHRTEKDYMIAAEGIGYVIPGAIFKGFQGQEVDGITRTLPDGLEAYLAYAKPYFDRFKIDVCNRVINGFTVADRNTMEKAMAPLAPTGNFLQNSTAGKYDLQVINGVPYARMFDPRLSSMEDFCADLLDFQQKGKERGSNFIALSYCDIGTNYGTPTGVCKMVQAYAEYVAQNAPGTKVQYVDMNTFLRLIVKSGQGVEPIIGIAPPTLQS